MWVFAYDIHYFYSLISSSKHRDTENYYILMPLWCINHPNIKKISLLFWIFFTICLGFLESELVLHLEPILKFGRNIASSYFNEIVPCFNNRNKNNNKQNITKIPDELWDKVCTILPKEKPNNTVGRSVIS